MKLIAACIGMVVVGAATWIYLGSRPSATPLAPRAPVATFRDSEQVARLTEQIGEMQRNIATLKSQLATQNRPPDAAAAVPAAAADSPPTPGDLEARRAADEERYHAYMAGVAQDFSHEKIDAAWAKRTSSRVETELQAVPVLRDSAHRVECHQQTCRLEIDGENWRQVSANLPALALRLADALPSMNADRVDRGNGNFTTVLYMSSQTWSGPVLPKN